MKNKRILITEDDRYRILSMHDKLRTKEFGLINEVFDSIYKLDMIVNANADDFREYLKYVEENVEDEFKENQIKKMLNSFIKAYKRSDNKEDLSSLLDKKPFSEVADELKQYDSDYSDALKTYKKSSDPNMRSRRERWGW
jgi:hypothetical protein